MHRIDTPGAVDSKFVAGNPTIPGESATKVSPDWLTAVQEEPAAVIEGAGLTLNKADNTQLLAAIEALISRRIRLDTSNGGSSQALGTGVGIPLQRLQISLAAGQQLRLDRVRYSVAGDADTRLRILIASAVAWESPAAAGDVAPAAILRTAATAETVDVMIDAYQSGAPCTLLAGSGGALDMTLVTP